MSNRSIPMPHPQQHVQTVIVRERKSMGLAFLLTFLFGPLGMLYTTVAGALIMLVISLLIGWLIIPLPFIWIVCIVWAMAAV